LGTVFEIDTRPTHCCLPVDCTISPPLPMKNEMKLEISYHQERLWFIDQFEKGYLYEANPTYHNVPVLLEIEGDLEYGVLRQSIQAVVDQHEVLQTNITLQADTLCPRVSGNRAVGFETGTAACPATALDEALAFAKQPFSLTDDLLVRSKIFSISGQAKHLLVVVVHHIVIDKPSVRLLAGQLLDQYACLTGGPSGEATGEQPSYFDYAVWQKRLPEATIEKMLRFWKRKLHGELQPLDLPSDNRRSFVHIYREAVHTESLEGMGAEAVATFARLHDYSPEVVLLSAFKVLLSKYCRQKDVITGISYANRGVLGTSRMIGPVANLLPIRTVFGDSPSFLEVLGQVSADLGNALRYGAMPFDLLVQKINPGKDMARTALFDVLFQYEEAAPLAVSTPHLCVRHLDMNLGWGKYDLNLLVQRHTDAFEFTLVYNREYYRPNTAGRLLSGYLNLLQHLLKDPAAPVLGHSYTTAEDRFTQLYGWNKPYADYPKDKSIVDMFRETAARFPDRPALSFDGNRLTYRELDHKSDALAGVLAGKGITLGQIVGLMAERSLEMVVGLLGILKAGGAYLPLDPALPAERVRYMVQDSGVKFLLTHNADIDLLSPDVESIAIDLPGLESTATESACRVDTRALAYVIYTSGTTGKPKGVMIEHEQVVRLFFTDTPLFDFSEHDVWTMFHSFSFDFSVWEMWGAFFFGSELVVVPAATAKDPDALLRLLEEKRVTILNQTPSAFYNLAQTEAEAERPLSRLRKVIFGGEELKPARLAAWRNRHPGVQLVNMYGITEVTVHASYKEITQDEIHVGASVIGTPIPTTTLYLLDENGLMVPTGVPGEIYVGGAGLARGYLNRPELTRQRFVTMPALPEPRLYRTGDLARYHENGDLEFLGRLDKQVQIRGYRVEMGEIESRLAAFPGISEAFAWLRAQEDNQVLYGYYVADRPLKSAEIKQYLAGTLPDYMIPAHLIQIGEVPLTGNGKINYKALPLQEETTREELLLPTTPTEYKLAELYAQVLGIDPGKIGINASFFELGGHSLKATLLIAQVKKTFGVKLPVAALFQFADIRRLAACIGELIPSGLPSPEPAARRESYPLSPAQKRLYVLQKMDEVSLLYNLTQVYQLEDSVQTSAIEHALARLIERHESLRTYFTTEADVPVQKVDPRAPFVLLTVNCKEHQLAEFLKGWVRPFDLGRAPLMRAAVVQTGWRRLLVLDIHHLITDGVSNQVLMRDFVALLKQGQLPPVALQYKDFSEWQNSLAYREEAERSKRYWVEKFSGEIPLINLPLDYARPLVKSFEGNTIPFTLGADTRRKLSALARREGVTLYTVLLSAYYVLLRKITGQGAFVVGSPAAGRSAANLENTVGMFINVLPLSSRTPSRTPFAAYIREVHTQTLEAFEHQIFQFEDLVDAVVKTRDTSRNPLFDVMFDYHNEGYAGNSRELKGMKNVTDEAGYRKQTAMFDLNLHLYESGDELLGELDYCSKLFKADSAARFVRLFTNIVGGICEQPDQEIYQIEGLTDEERKQLLFDYNNTAHSYSRHKLVHQLFEERIALAPHNPAVVTGEGLTCTYEALNAYANRIAWALKESGVGVGTYVGITMDRSVGMVAAILAVLKAGGIYVPIEPHLPDARLAQLQSLLNIRYLIISKNQLPRLSAVFEASFPAKTCFCLEWEATSVAAPMPGDSPFAALITDVDLARYATHNPPVVATPGDCAYVIFTSGSTGTPKGVIVQHQPIINVIEWVNATLLVTEKDRLLFVTSLGFDLSVYDIFGVLAAGACIRLASGEELKNPARLLKVLIHEGITVWDSAPAALQQLLPLLAECDTTPAVLRQVMLSGDWIPVTMPDALRSKFRGVEVLSLGGATEATIWSNYYKVGQVDPAWKSILYGRPIQNASYYILDSCLVPCPTGTAGDLYIGGECLAAGYVNDEQLTREKFIPNPFVPGGKMYKTGDLALWRADGQMEFLGRKDSQVKIRGHRIEIGEVESQLSKCAGVRQALVMLTRGNPEDRQLCAYFTAEEQIDSETLRAALTAQLPGYMVPAYFVRLAAFPVTSNGKVDRQNLPDPRELPTPESTAVNLGETEKKLLALCAEVLHLELTSVRLHHNFFELGGHSLNATTFLAKIQKAFSVKLALAALFQEPVLGKIAGKIKQLQRESGRYESIRPAPDRPYYKLSSAQKRIYILHQLDGNNIGHSYNIPLAFRISGNIDLLAIEATLRALIGRHEALRTSFSLEDGLPVQRVHGQVAFDLEHYQAPGEDDLDGCIREFIRPFDLEKAPLMRAGIVSLGQAPSLLMFDLHHLVSDGVSQQILVREFMTLYEGGSLPAVSLHYKDYAEWQSEQQGDERLREQKVYWMREFAEEYANLELPTDFARTAGRSYEGATTRFVLGGERADALRWLAEKEGATLFMTLLALLNVLLAKLSGQPDVVIGVPTAGRNHADLEGAIGVLLNTLAIRNNPCGELPFRQFLERVKKKALKAFENQDYQYEDLVNDLKMNRDNTHNPLFNAVFILQNMGTPQLEIPQLTLEPYPFANDIAKIDISFLCKEVDKELVFDVEYSKRLFKPATINRIIMYLNRLIDQVTADPEMKIADLQLITEREQEQILRDFNHTATPINRAMCYHQVLEEQVRQTPQAVAATHNGQTITYEQLNAAANKIAHYLRAGGVGTGLIVGLYFRRGIPLLAAMLGVLKSGACYVAIDDEYPEFRIEGMFRQSEVRVVLVDEGLEPEVRRIQNSLPLLTRVLAFSDVGHLFELLETYSAHNPYVSPEAGDTAYIIYTSGTTGVPKGVMVHQLGMLNHMYGLINKLQISDRDVMVQTASCSSDIFVVQYLLMLIKGGRVCILDKADVVDPHALLEKLQQEQVTLMEIVPSLLSAFLDDIENLPRRQLPALRYMLTMGEAIKAATARKWYACYPSVALVNAYGPAEASDDVSLYRINAAQLNDNFKVPIGYPLDNLHLYVMDERFKLCPVGIIGQICVSGIAVGKGYWRDEEKTRQVFLPNPLYGRIGDEDYRTIYCTGDLGYWQEDGSLLFVGRKDHMVKIRGFRVELGDIENHLLNAGGIRNAVVIDRTSPDGTKYLCAYYVSDQEVSAAALRQKLLGVLPPYMIPAHFIRLEKIPLTPSDKVDRAALPMTGQGEWGAGQPYAAPGNEVEKMILDIWSAELEAGKIGVDSNFFEVGGDSIKAIRIRARMLQKGLKAEIRDLFQYPTVKDIALYLATADTCPSAATKGSAAQSSERKPAGDLLHLGLSAQELDSLFDN